VKKNPTNSSQRAHTVGGTMLSCICLNIKHHFKSYFNY